MLMKQNDRADLDDIGRDIALPEIVRKRIMGYPLPEQQPAGAQKFAAFTTLHLDAQRPVCGTVNNVVSGEMLYCASSSGEHFDKRARALRRYEDPVQGIITEAAR